jgi:hypothetical protein
MNELKSIDYINSFMKTYQAQGTHFGDGLSSGDFTMPGFLGVTRGVQSMDIRVYTPGYIPEALSQEIFKTEVDTVDAAPQRYYIPLESSVFPNSFQQLYKQDPVKYGNTTRMVSATRYSQPNDSGEVFINPVERQLQIECNKEFNVRVSGYTMYDQKIVCEGVAEEQESGEFIFICTSGMAALSAITFDCEGPFEIKVSATQRITLPFTDWGNRSNFLMVNSSQANRLPYRFVAGAVRYVNLNAFAYTPAETNPNNLGLNTGTVRPQVNIGYYNGVDALSPSYQYTYFCWQNINPNFFGNYFPQNETESIKLSNVTDLKGITPYSTGWEDWVA